MLLYRGFLVIFKGFQWVQTENLFNALSNCIFIHGNIKETYCSQGVKRLEKKGLGKNNKVKNNWQGEIIPQIKTLIKHRAMISFTSKFPK